MAFFSSDLMSGTGYDYASAAKKLEGFLKPNCRIKVGTQKKFEDIVHVGGIFVTDVRVDLQIEGMAGCASFDVINAYDPIKGAFRSDIIGALKLGEAVEISLGYGSEMMLVFVGYINSVSSSFGGSSMPTLQITCMDYCGMMLENERNEQPKEAETYDQFIRDYVKKNYSMLKIGTVDGVGGVTKSPVMEKCSDYQMFSSMAEEIGFEFFILQDKVYFRKPYLVTSPVTTLTWGQNIISFSRELSMRTFVAEIEVRSFKQQGNEQVFVAVESSTKGKEVSSTAKPIRRVITDYSAKTQQDVDARAKAEIQKIERQSLGGNCTCIGFPPICPGRFVKLDRLSGELNGKYYVMSVSHSFGGGGFTTSFRVGRKT